MIALLLADGFEEVEALTPLDMLIRAGADVKTVGIGKKIIKGAHGIEVVADIEDASADASEFDMAIFPGGMPGSLNLDGAEFTDKIIDSVNKKGGRLAAICAAPLVLGRRGLLKGLRATCYPGFEKELTGAVIENRAVVTDGRITTAKGMGVALEFGHELVSLLYGKERADALFTSIMKDN